MRSPRGFTLVEALVTLAVLAILLGVFFVNLRPLYNPLEGQGPAPVEAPPPQVQVPEPVAAAGATPRADTPTCPECGAPVKVEDGCLTCEVCGWSKCG